MNYTESPTNIAMFVCYGLTGLGSFIIHASIAIAIRKLKSNRTYFLFGIQAVMETGQGKLVRN